MVCLNTLWKSLFGLSTDIESQLFIDEIHSFMVPFISRVTNAKEQFSKTVSWMFMGKMVEHIDHFLVITLLAFIIQGTSVEFQCCPRLTNTELMLTF